MNNKLTIVLTTYNRPKSLKSAIDSILFQSFKYFKLVILDNGSNKETSNLIMSYNDNRIEYIKNDVNDLEFLNRAFTFTKLKYLMITHDDDTMEEGLIERHISKMDSDNRIGLISSSINLINNQGYKLNKVRPRLKKDKRWTKEQFIQDYFFKGDIYLVRQAYLDQALLLKTNLIMSGK